MALVTRVSRLLRADLHAVLDRIEEPEALLRQAVREMEEELARDEHRRKVLAQEHERLNADQAELDRAARETEEELDICFAAEKEELARVLVKRKLEAEQLGKQLARRQDSLREALAAINARLDENRARVENMRQKCELLAAQDTTELTDEGWAGPRVSVREEEIEVAFLREKQRRGRS